MNDSRSSRTEIPVAVLGATGSVGQRFVQLLAEHPWFRVAEVVASDRSAGKPYREATDWRLDAVMPEGARELRRQGLRRRAREPGRLLGAAGRGRRRDRAAHGSRGPARCFSNTSTHRMDARRAAADPGGQPGARRGARGATPKPRLDRLHRHQPELLGDPPGPGAEAAPGRVRPRRTVGDDDAGGLRRRLPRRALARHDRQRRPLHRHRRREDGRGDPETARRLRRRSSSRPV